MIGLVGTIIPHDGAIGWVDGRLQSSGAVPSAAQFGTITGFLDTATRGGIYHTDELAAACPAAADFADIAAGVLVLQRNDRRAVKYLR